MALKKVLLFSNHIHSYYGAINITETKACIHLREGRLVQTAYRNKKILYRIAYWIKNLQCGTGSNHP